MNNFDKMSVENVEIGIAAAREFAEQKGVAFSLERLGVALFACGRDIQEYAAQDDEGLTRSARRKRDMLRAALCEIAAAHVEHGMTRGNNPTIDKLCLSEHFGYGEKNSEPEEQFPPVVFVGEDALPE